MNLPKKRDNVEIRETKKVSFIMFSDNSVFFFLHRFTFSLFFVKRKLKVNDWKEKKMVFFSQESKKKKN